MVRSAYIHLPFCKTKCPYCDFASEAISPVEHQQRSETYIARLLAEIDYRATNAARPMVAEMSQLLSPWTIYFGGGTPSLESPETIAGIIKHLRRYYTIDADAEITLEANPGTIDRAKLAAFKDAGVNRISIGVQTFDPVLLQKLGRGHSIEDTERALSDVASLGFKSWSLDLIYGLPGQTVESWQQTLERALEFKPAHISAYALSIEATTPYGAYYKSSKHPELPIEDEVATMYEITAAKLQAAGLARYEISNWAQPGHESQHNLTYWLADEYLAVGVGAHGYLNSKRYANPKQLSEYMTIDFSEQEQLEISLEESRIETILLGLRLESGIDLIDELKPYINVAKLEQFTQLGLIERGPTIKLTDRGILLSNKVIAELLTTNAV